MSDISETIKSSSAFKTAEPETKSFPETAEGVRSLARDLMEEFGVGDWTLKLTNAKRALGRVKVKSNRFTGELKKKTLILSRIWFVELGHSLIVEEGGSEDLLEDVIRHEIAHALDVEERGTTDHGNRWKLKCEKTGADPTREAEGVPDSVDHLIAEWFKVCPTCGDRQAYFGKPKANTSCAKCSDSYDPEHKHEIVKNDPVI